MRASCRAGSTTAHRSAKPSATASYAYSLAGHVLPALGARRLGDVRLRDVQALVDGMARARADASTIRNALMPLRVIFRRALARGDIAVNPVTGVVLPAVRGRRERFATPAEAAALISAVAERDRAVWATAFYAGLRRGELRGLRWEDLDFERGTIHVRRTWDRYARADVQPKSHAGRREVPFALVLQEYLLRHRAAFSGHERVFATSSGAPFDPGDLARRAGKAWAASGLDSGRRPRRLPPDRWRHADSR